MDNVEYRSALDLKRAILAKEVSPVEVVQAALERQAVVEDKINAFVTVTDELALDAAKNAEAETWSASGVPTRNWRIGSYFPLRKSTHNPSAINFAARTFLRRTLLGSNRMSGKHHFTGRVWKFGYIRGDSGILDFALIRDHSTRRNWRRIVSRTFALN